MSGDREIWAWLETQKPATEFAGTLLQGVQNVVKLKDQEISTLQLALLELWDLRCPGVVPREETIAAVRAARIVADQR